MKYPFVCVLTVLLCGSPAQAQLARRPALATALSATNLRAQATRYRIPGRLRLLRRRFSRSPAGQGLAQLRRKTKAISLAIDVKITAIADRLQQRLPARAAKRFERVRAANPLAALGFLLRETGRHPTALFYWKGPSFAASALLIPGLAAIGFGPASIFWINFVVDLALLPVGFSVANIREAGSWRTALISIAQRYREFVRSRRAHHRAISRAKKASAPTTATDL